MKLYKLIIPYIHNNFEHKLSLTIEAENVMDAYGQIIEISRKLTDEGKNVGVVHYTELNG